MDNKDENAERIITTVILTDEDLEVEIISGFILLIINTSETFT